MLFADVRGYTSLTEQRTPAETTAFVNRLYEVAGHALLSEGGLLGQIAGDQVMALYVPGLAGRDYMAKAVDGARGLLKAVGYGGDGNWVDLGVGIASGEEFVGNVGGSGYKDFTAIGDVTNTAARLTAQAAGGEILVDGATFASVAEAYPTAERRLLELKGKAAPVETYVIPPG